MRQSERVPTMSKRRHDSGTDVQLCVEDNMINRDFQSHQNLTELHDESLYSWYHFIMFPGQVLRCQKVCYGRIDSHFLVTFPAPAF